MTIINKEEMPQSSTSPELEEKLKTLQKKIDNYKVRFNSALSVVGSEFVRPLTSIKGYLGLLESSFPKMGSKEKRYFRKTEEAVNGLESLVEMYIRMLSIKQSGQLIGEMKKVRFSDLVDQVLGKYCENPGKIVNEVDKNIPPVKLRKKYLEVALGNLFSNAEKFGGSSTPPGVTAGLSGDDKTDQNEKLLIINVYDYGAGIPQDMKEKVFLPFFRVDPSDSKCGLGLGLSMAADAVSFINGKIDLQSVPGVGTTVVVSVPVLVSDTPAHEKTV
ncbi:MAG: HAMP domain-containing sensor histidine kinase [Candidatus Krumholzibacteriota bacterium]|nr:HAMP domain-containing sensor histidine kinase [Candidatus Krumholzibacteriota bacterium]